MKELKQPEGMNESVQTSNRQTSRRGNLFPPYMEIDRLTPQREVLSHFLIKPNFNFSRIVMPTEDIEILH